MAQDKMTACEWQVSGMDCGACAAKLQGAVEFLPGVAGVDVALMAGRLRLQLDEAQTSRSDIEAAVRRLGYGITDAAGPDPAAPMSPPPRPWYHTGKGRLLITTGGLLIIAFAIELLIGGAVAHWAFIIATLLGVAPIARQALLMARMRMPFTIEMLMTIAASGALLIGAAGEAALVVFLFALGEMLEGIAAGRARSSIRALADLVPKSAQLVTETGIQTVEAASLGIGQVVQVRPGDRVPADGVVVSGQGELDESPVTGESIPVAKPPGAEVYAGSINAGGVLDIRVTRTAADNTIARIVQLVEEAESARAPTERFIERFSRWYMPAITGIAALVVLLPPLLTGAAWDIWIYRGLALLLIGCPCALVISVPASVAAALSAGARHGLLLKGGAILEAAGQVDLIAFDKTGTLTNGRPAVTDVIAIAAPEGDLLRLAAAVEAGASHPLGQAILAQAQAAGLDWPKAHDAGAIPGKGAFARVEGQDVTVGSLRLAAESGLDTGTAEAQAATLEAMGKTVIAVFTPDRLLGLIGLRDEARPDAAPMVVALREMGIKSVMLTGDNPRTGAAIAGEIGLDHRAGLLPEDKVTALRDLTVGGTRVMMVGDGINDAPALASADIGIAMGAGADVALETADGALLRNHVSDVLGLLRLSRRAMAIIRQNVAIALGLKLVFLITTIIGMTGLWIAILADTGATVLVTLNALRLLGFRLGEPPQTPPASPHRATIRPELAA